MANFTIAYDLHGVTDRSIYESISKEILRTNGTVKLLNTTFFISGTYSADSVAKWLKDILSKYWQPDNFEYVVVEVASWQFWLNKTTRTKLDSVRGLPV